MKTSPPQTNVNAEVKPPKQYRPKKPRRRLPPFRLQRPFRPKPFDHPDMNITVSEEDRP